MVKSSFVLSLYDVEEIEEIEEMEERGEVSRGSGRGEGGVGGEEIGDLLIRDFLRSEIRGGVDGTTEVQTFHSLSVVVTVHPHWQH